MFPWINVHIINSYVDKICIHEDDTNSSKDNLPPPLPVPYPKIYPKVVPKNISYSKTSHFVILFVDVVHVQESKIVTLPVSTSKHSLSFTTHFNSSEAIMMQWKVLMSYTLASTSLVNFGPPFITYAFVFPLVLICAFFDFNPYGLMHKITPLIYFLITL